ncbi:hypothetical protein [uncultured Roseibium sp.]|uniref:hypothetical protein n=1 Tax=uncultured Roseibium sp. TaxID=1936171 RepID=UPI0026118EB8|nr:hypothetical protein [uncultured Roseibium sp.]
MADETEIFGAQVVLKQSDGSSILDATESLTAATIERYRLPAETVGEARKALEALGFRVVGDDGTTLSVEGSRAHFAEVFGLEVGAAQAGVAAHATKIPDDAQSFVADVIVPPKPSLFP